MQQQAGCWASIACQGKPLSANDAILRVLQKPGSFDLSVDVLGIEGFSDGFQLSSIV